jgi:hypothetical protein
MASRGRAPVLWLAAALFATACPPAGPTINLPRANALVDDPGVAIDLKVPQSFTPTATIVRVDGVDLVAALGLVPPFANASGSVAIGADTIAVTGFTWTIPPSGPVAITATLTGLSSADHVLDAQAFPAAGGATVTKSRSFAVVEPMTLEAHEIASSGTPAPPPVSANHAGNATLGESLAAPPVALSNGAVQLRAGYVPAAQGRAGGL